MINGHPDNDPRHVLHAAADAYVRGVEPRAQMRPDFAFRTRRMGLPEKLLAGRSAWAIKSMGMPSLSSGLFCRSHSLKNLKRNIFGFVGFPPVQHSIIGAVEGSAAHRGAWLHKLERLG